MTTPRIQMRTLKDAIENPTPCSDREAIREALDRVWNALAAFFDRRLTSWKDRDCSQIVLPPQLEPFFEEYLDEHDAAAGREPEGQGKQP